jgi:DNA helicase-2/ATP-dependent DNA helicase PcrA
VAITRARHELLLTGSFWGTQSRPRVPSPYLLELATAEVIASPPTASAHVENPMGEDLESVTWPRDPLGSRRDAVEAAAEAVRSADPQVRGTFAREIGLLLAERRERAAGSPPIALPVRIPASRFHDYVEDPARVAAALRRPMPERPYRATRLGTLFHAWVESRSLAGGDAEELDASTVELDLDDEVEVADLDRLRATFEASPWAQRRPVEVEREIHVPFEGRIVVCKIDAVYQLDDGRFEIVDWKTGRAPADEADLERKQLQLALYRLAVARWRAVFP